MTKTRKLRKKSKKHKKKFIQKNIIKAAMEW